jgi:hypothetical protein
VACPADKTLTDGYTQKNGVKVPSGNCHLFVNLLYRNASDHAIGEEHGNSIHQRIAARAPGTEDGIVACA